MSGGAVASEFPIVRKRFIRLMDTLEAVGRLLKDGSEALQQFYDEDANQPEHLQEEQELLASMSPTDAFWRAWDGPIRLLPIACLAFGQAVFEAFLLDMLATLSTTRDLKPVPRRIGFQRILKEYSGRFGVEINVTDRQRLDDFVATRNLWVHNAGLVDAEYAATASEQVMPGELREVSPNYVSYALWSFDDAARQIVRALFGATTI